MNKIADLLLDEKALFLRPHEPFTWASGIKSPVYCDNRLLLHSPEAFESVTQAFSHLIDSHQISFDLIAGTATAGIPWASFLAFKLKKPMIYVRSSAKEHGRQNLVEGKLPKNSNVLLIEDLISTGKSSLKAAQAIKDEGANIQAVLSIFTYDFLSARENFKRLSLETYSLCSLDSLLVSAIDKKLITQKEATEVTQWRHNIQN
jgi:orotate phosphoribosyltransferase